MKIMISLLLVLFMVLMISPGVAPAFAEDSATHALLSDYLDYLNRTEQNNTALLWALPYVHNALAENTWESILKARLAVSATSLYVEATELAEAQTSSAMYDEFKKNEQDVSLVKASRQGYSQKKKTLLDSLCRIAFELESGIFSKKSVENLMIYVQQNQQYSELELEYLAASTDYLIGELGTSETVDKFQKAVQEACPIIYSYQSDASMPQEKTESRGIEILDKIEGLVGKMEQLTTQMQLDLDDFVYAYETGNVTAIEEEQNNISGLPNTLPFPLWEEETDSSVYFYNGNDGHIKVPKPGDLLVVPPDGCYLTYYGVNEDAIYSYMLLLMDNGVEVLEDTIGDDYFEAHCSFKGTSFYIIWEPEAATIDMPNGILCLKLF